MNIIALRKRGLLDLHASQQGLTLLRNSKKMAGQLEGKHIVLPPQNISVGVCQLFYSYCRA